MASGADILHTHGLWQHPSWAALAWKRRYGKPHVVSVRGMLEPWAWRHKAWKKRPVWWLWEQRNLQSASLLHATSEQEAETLRERGLTAPIAIIPNGVEMPVGRDGLDAPTSSSIQNSKSKIRNRPRTALFLSRIHPIKGLPLLLEAWARIREQETGDRKPEEWQLRIVGPDEGGHVEELKGLCDKLGLGYCDASNIEHRTSNIEHRSEESGDSLASTLTERRYRAEQEPDPFKIKNSKSNIIFSGALTGEAKETAFRDADLFILPTHSENFGIAVAEAMAHGLPVITTHGAPWKLLESERCGWWVPVSVDGIATALDDAMRRSPEELAAMGARGRKVVEERFAWEGIARQMIECYEWVQGEGEVPDCVRQL
jgi:glycosyltransferase involved in cell wall biosynthesis